VTKFPSCGRYRSGSGWHTGACGGPDSEILVRGVSYPQGFHTFFLAGSTSLSIDALQQRRGTSMSRIWNKFMYCTFAARDNTLRKSLDAP
jgi:hypothetical protein